MAEQFYSEAPRTRASGFERVSAPVETVAIEAPVARSIVESSVQAQRDAAINRTVSTMPRFRVFKESRKPFSAVRQPIKYPRLFEPVKKTRIVPAGADVTTMTRIRNIRAVQPPETLDPGATVSGEPVETTQVPPVPVEAGMDTFVDVALAQENPIAKWGLIALGVGIFVWSLQDTRKRSRR